MPETPEAKLKRKRVERILRQFQSWKSLVESHNMQTITVEGDEYHYMDMLEGLAALPPRQREAVWYMCVLDLSEAEAARRMGFENVQVSPAQQYKSFGLARFIAFLEAEPDEQANMKQKVTKYGKNPRKKRVKKVVPDGASKDLQ